MKTYWSHRRTTIYTTLIINLIVSSVKALNCSSLRHKNLVLLIGVVLDDPLDLYMVTEFMANGNLVDFLRSRGRHQVERPQLLQFAL